VSASGSRPGSEPWKVTLALISVGLTLLLWINGLLESLQRPSVGNTLNQRQLELAVLAAPQLPANLRAPLVGEAPERLLLDELNRQAVSATEGGTPESASNLLERGLLEASLGRNAQARSLFQQVGEGDLPSLQAPLVEALVAGDRIPLEQAQRLSAPLANQPLMRQLGCRQLTGNREGCREIAAERQAALNLVMVNLLPAFALFVGVALLFRELWLRRPGKGPVAPPLVGPNLGLVDATLLVAGGFVVLGDLVTPLLIRQPTEALLKTLQITSPLSDGISVLIFYLGLMSCPLLILALMLRRGAPPEGGWLQFRWHPLGLNGRRAFKTFLMVLPLVSLMGWLVNQFLGDQGGSNPLLELVLNSQNLPALACFALTAVVLAPLFEETIFRGVLLPVLGRELGVTWGIVVSSLMFGIAHLSLSELPPLFLLGLGLGWLRWSGGRLGACVILHALWNGITFLNLVVLGG
jgi:hypothetical protein